MKKIFFVFVVFLFCINSSAQDFLKFVNIYNDTVPIFLVEIDTATVNYIGLTETAAIKFKKFKAVSAYINVQDSNKWVKVGIIDSRASDHRGYKNLFLSRENIVLGIQYNRMAYRGTLIYNELIKRNMIRNEDEVEYPYEIK